MKARGPVVAVVALIAVAGCGGGRGAEQHGLLPVPHPDLDRADAVVREQIEGAREELDSQLRDPGSSQLDLAPAFGQLGMIYHAYDLRDAAQACYRNARSLDGREARWAYYLADVLRLEGDAEAASRALGEAVGIDADYLPAVVRLGQVELELTRLDRAEELFRQALEIDPRCAEALIGLGKIALSRGEFSAAVERLESARSIAPTATRIHYPLGLAYRGQGNLEAAVHFLERRGEIPAQLEDPWLREVQALRRGMLVHLNRGISLAREGRNEQAVRAFRRAVELAPNDAAARANLGHGLAQIGDLDTARAELEQALRLDPGNAVAQFNLGAVYARLGRDEAAVPHYRAALEIDPELTVAHVNLGNSLRRLDRFQEALEQFSWVVEHEPGHAAARLSEGLVLIRLGRFADARERLQRSHAALPRDANILQALVRVLAASPEDAVRDGPLAMRLARPLVAEAAPFDHLEAAAMVAAENGDFTTALELQGRALQVIGAGAPQPLIDELHENERRYRRGQPCRRPWPQDGPVLSPGRTTR